MLNSTKGSKQISTIPAKPGKTLRLKRLLALLIMTSLFSITTQAQTTPLDDYVLTKMNDSKIPGLAFTIVKDGKVVLAKGYGYADVDKDIPFTPNTIHHEIISESKIVTATAVLKLWELGQLQLDSPINNYLPFAVSNPFYPDVAITARMLFAHKASIADISNDESFHVPPGTAQDLGGYLHDYLVPGGALYNASTNFYNYAPGTQYTFSNTDYALLGYLVQVISGVPFDQFCNENIFQPLCMNHTAWYHCQSDTNITSRPYYYMKNSINHPIDFGLYEVPWYPSAQLKTTEFDWSRFMIMHMNYGELDGVRIIDSTTEVLMRENQVVIDSNSTVQLDVASINFRREECLGWYHVIEYSNDNKEYFGRNGNDIGTVVQSWFNTSDKTIITVYCNGFSTGETVLSVFAIYEYLNLMIVDSISSSGMPDLNCEYSFNPCQHDDSYWRNNSLLWALNYIPMKLGTKHYYSKNQILSLLDKPVNGDASISLAKSLIAAKLNAAQGSELSVIISTINSAMDIIGSKRLPYDVPVSFSSSKGIKMLALAATLDSYNSGALNTTACSGSSERENTDADIPVEYSIACSPNPFSSTTSISFSLPQTENVSLKIFDVNGRLLRTLVAGESTAGAHQVEWSASDVEAGIYFLWMETATHSENRKLIVVK
ncbi:MAG TPA: serine hydrolase [Chitinophagales bacterium]|nr:serine hydrolase [Chitinophagales bacterium]